MPNYWSKDERNVVCEKAGPSPREIVEIVSAFKVLS